MGRMTRCLITILSAAAVSFTGIAAGLARNPSADVEVLVNGAAVPRYAHAGRWYVEALDRREYSIRLRNPYPVRVAVALSVDGLNTIDARQTTAAGARKWVLDPYESVVITGWQTSRTNARRFEFTTEGASYARALGKDAHLGLISAVFFRERPRSAVPYTSGRDAESRQAAGVPAPEAAEPARAPAAGAPAARSESAAKDEYAATGMGRSVDHTVTQVWLDLEETPARTIDIRYEFRPQLVRLGILRPESADDPLGRRERARGFEPAFAPVPPGLR